MQEFALDSNWLRLWALNGNEDPNSEDATSANAGTGGARGVAISNPDLIRTNTGMQKLYVGVTYKIRGTQEGDKIRGETLLGIAARFRTTVKSILSMNFDDNLHNKSAVPMTGELPPGQEVCLIPCSTRPAR